MNPNHVVLIVVYQAFNARNLDAVLGMMHPDVDWPNGMEGGRILGVASVRDYWTRQWAMIDPQVEPISMAENESGQTIVQVHQVVRDLKGKVLVDQTIQHVYTLNEGLILRMDIVSADAQAI